MIRKLTTTGLALALAIGMGVSLIPQAQAAHSVTVTTRTTTTVNTYVHRHQPAARTIDARVSQILISGDRSGMLVMNSGPYRNVFFTPHTTFARRYGGPIGPSDVAAGDRLIITGHVGAHGKFTATSVRDMSIWVHGVATHVATVSSVNKDTNTIILTGDNWRNENDTVTVRYTEQTQFIYANGSISNDNQLRVGDKVRIHGQARLQNGNITIINVAKIWVLNH